MLEMKATLKKTLLFLVILSYLFLCYYLNQKTVFKMSYLEILFSAIGCICPLIMIYGLYIIINKQ